MCHLSLRIRPSFIESYQVTTYREKTEEALIEKIFNSKP